MSKKTPAKNKLLTERNRIRGLIGTIKGSQRSGPRSKSAAPERPDNGKRFQRALAGAMIKSRQSLATGQFDSFVSWMEAQTSTQLAGLTQLASTSPELLREVLGSQPLPLAKEILWIVARLAPHTKVLEGFLSELKILQNIYWRGDWKLISKWLDRIEIEYGGTLWLIETKISLLQEFEGIESQKKVVSEQKKLGHRSLAAYVAYHLSVRNEPTTDLARYRSELSSRLTSLKISDSLRTFLRLRLLGRLPANELEASQALQIAQSLSDIDLFDVLMRVCQSDVVSQLLRDRRGAAWASLSRLGGLDDPRLRSVLVTDQLVHELEDSEPLRGIRSRMRALESDPNRHRLAIECAGLLINVRKSVVTDGPLGSPWGRLIRSMARVLRFDGSHDSELAALAKYHANHSYINAANECWNLFCAEITQDQKIDTNAANVGGLSLLGLLQSEINYMPQWAVVLRLLGGMSRAIEVGELGRVIEGLVYLRLKLGVPLSALPLKTALSTVRWKQLKPYRSALSLPIALHLCWRATDSDLAATNLRYAYEEFLDSQHLGSPVDLVRRQLEFDLEELIYFLREVCVPVVMDMSQRIKTSRGVEELRSQVCAVLRELDPGNETTYQAEIVSIIHSHSLAEGQTVVDSSRVHVDTNALRAWAARSLTSDLQRYAALVEAGDGIAENLETILRSAQSPTHHVNYLEIPDSEADSLLIELMIALRWQFLLDPQHGLDSYLSRRVRHHSMTGYIRGPVEEAKLITSRNTKSGRYAPNSYWLDKLAPEGARRSAVARSFEQFAEDFDGIVIGLKKGLFHVRSSDHPKGLFDIHLSPPMIHIGRSAIQQEISVEIFCSVCFSLFWAGLDFSLKEAQRHLRHATKAEVAGAFQRLRASLRRELDRSSYDDASITIQTAAESVQREIDRMADWFVRREVQQSLQFYAMSKVLEIAISSALASHRPFDFDIDRKVDCEIYVRTGDLVVIAEVVLTALGNVKAHAGRSRGPVRVSLCSQTRERVCLRIANPIDKEAMSTQARARIDQIRDEISDGSYIDRIRSEGGSGLMKIAATVKQSPYGSLDFGIEDNQFFVETTFGFVEEIGALPNHTCGRLVG